MCGSVDLLATGMSQLEPISRGSNFSLLHVTSGRTVHMETNFSLFFLSLYRKILSTCQTYGRGTNTAPPLFIVNAVVVESVNSVLQDDTDSTVSAVHYILNESREHYNKRNGATQSSDSKYIQEDWRKDVSLSENYSTYRQDFH